MPGKLQNVQELMEERISTLWKNPENYVAFLETASRLYKYSFKDQILIHAQRPDAVACAEYDTWGREDITNRQQWQCAYRMKCCLSNLMI